MRKLAILLSSVLCALCLILGIAACGGNAAKEAIDMYLLPQNETAVNADFSLPKKIGDGIEVTWKSSNTDAIAIEDAGEEYTAKVTLQPEVTEVTLTISAEGASKDFHVRVEQLSVYTFMQNYTFKQKNTAVKEGFELDTVAKYKDLTATIAWEVKDAASKAYIEINGNKVIVHPDDDLVNVEIVAKFTYNGQSVEATYPFSVSPILEHRQTVNRYYSVTDYPLELSGYIVHVVEASESYGNATFYMIDDDFCSGYYCYRVKIDTADVAKYVEGAHVTVSGDTTKNYNGLWENNSGGKAVIDDKAPINPREKEKVYALDTDLLAGAPSMLWHESTFVSLTGWKVVDKAEKKPTAADSNLFAVQNGNTKITVRVTKYAQRTDAELTALLDVYDSVENGDIVNVVGILGNYNGFQIQPILASDITKTTATEVTSYPNGAKVKAAVDAVAAAVKKNFPGCIIEHKEITMPTTAENAEGVTISYRLAGGNKDNPIKNPTVVIDGGKFTIDPVADKMKNYDIEVTYTIGEDDNAYKAYSFFTLSNKQMTAEEVVEAVAKAVRNKKTVVIDDVTGAKTFYIDYTTVYGSEKVEWKVKGTAPEWLHVSGNKVTIDYLPMEETEVTLEATITFGDKSTTVDRKFTVAAMPRTMFQMLEEAKAGTYKFAMYNGNLSTTYYVTGTMDGAYLATTTEAAKGANFVITQIGTENKYTITINGKYLEFAPREDGKSGVDTKMNDKQTEGKYWQWVDAIKNFVFESLYNKDGNTESTETDFYYFGTYNNYTTVNGNYISRIADKGDDGTYTANGKEGDGQWVAHFGTVVDATDKAWADEVLASLSPKTTYTEAGTETLPTTGKYDAKVEWTLKGTSTSFSVANNKLTVTLPASGEVTATLHVVVTVGKETAEKDVEITAKAPALIGKGTETEPFTVEDALTVGGNLGSDAYYQENGQDKMVYVEGVVSKAGSLSEYKGTIRLSKVYIKSENGTEELQIFVLYFVDDVLKAPATTDGPNPLKVGDHITVYGPLQNFKGDTVEITYHGDDNPTLVKYTAGSEETQSGLKLTSESFSELNPSETSGYNKYKGTHTVGDYSITVSDFMVNTYAKQNVVQFKKSSGSLTVTGNFSKITAVILSSYNFAADQVLVITAGSTALTPTLLNSVDTGEKNNNYAINKWTVEYPVTATGEQLFTLKGNSNGPCYVVSITFEEAEGGSTTPGGGSQTPAEGTTKDNSFTVVKALAAGNDLAADAYFGGGTLIYVTGYVIEVGKWDNGFKNFTGTWIADTATSTKTSADAIQVYRLYCDDTNLKLWGDLAVGMKITVCGYLQNYKGSNDEAKLQITYSSSDKANPSASAYTDTRDEDAKLQAAINNVAATLTASLRAAGTVELPASSVTGVELEWTTSQSGYSIANGALNVTTLPDGKTEITLAVKAKIGTKTSTEKTVTLTLEVPPKQPEGALELTRDTLFFGVSSRSYADHDNTYVVGNYSVTSKDVMGNTNNDYNVIQFKKSSGTLTVEGNFTKITVVLVATKAHDTTLDLVVKVGTTSITGTLTKTENGTKDGTFLYTVEYTISGTGAQTITLSGSSSTTCYIVSITLTEAAPAAATTATAPVAILPGKQF